jgi:ribosome maturation factor RimP
MSKEIAGRVRTVAEPIVSQEGMELVDLEYRREPRGWVLRLFVDKEGGVTLEDCARISRELGRNLDVEDFIDNPYALEVSSPGLDRPLKNPQDFMRYRDRLIRVKTFDPIENRRNFKGKLLGLSEDRIKLELDGRVVHIPMSKVAKANLVVEL